MQPNNYASVDRRAILQKAAVFASSAFALASPQVVRAEDFEVGLLESRVTEDLMSKVPYSIESNDIFYPSFFKGSWDVSSATTAVEAPCGTAMFGGNSTFLNAQNEIGPERALKYRARFIPSASVEQSPKVIADREYNVVEIAKAAMGENAVVDVPMALPNKFCCLLAPSGAGSMFTVDMITVGRRQEYVSKDKFDCSELVRQIVASPPSAGAKRQPSLKEIEAVSLYTAGQKNSEGKVDEIKCVQRVATFLVPIQEDPIGFRLWQMSRGRPVDVRFYELTYTRRA